MSKIEELSNVYFKIGHDLMSKGNFNNTSEIRNEIVNMFLHYLKDKVGKLRVICDETINTPEVVDDGEIIARVEWVEGDKFDEKINYQDFIFSKEKIKNIPTHDPQTGELNPYYEELTEKENPMKPKKLHTRSIKHMTEEELFHIADLATGGYFTSDCSKDHKEVEVGGYGWRRRVEWTQNTEGRNEYHYFEITGENKGLGWSWHSKTTEKLGLPLPNKPNWSHPMSYIINTLNPHKIVDYCREQKLDIENFSR